MNISEIETAGRAVINLRSAYHNAPERERGLDRFLFSYLWGKYNSVSRQHCVYLYGSNIPRRIDFRIGGTNPVVLEFAVRPPKGGVDLNAKQNLSELKKLCRVKSSEAKLRALLLVDLSDKPLSKTPLSTAYAALNAGRGNFERNPVRIVYVHSEHSFHFSWKPWR